jgi:hypothetical protein
MTVTIASLTFDCRDALVVGGFWSAAIGRPLDPGGTGEFASIGFPEHRDTAGWSVSREDGPTWLFNRVPEPKTAKNRMHVDVATPDPEAEIERLVELGAARVRDVEEYGFSWTVMRDPEGNEFCVAQER